MYLLDTSLDRKVIQRHAKRTLNTQPHALAVARFSLFLSRLAFLLPFVRLIFSFSLSFHIVEFFTFSLGSQTFSSITVAARAQLEELA